MAAAAAAAPATTNLQDSQLSVKLFADEGLTLQQQIDRRDPRNPLCALLKSLVDSMSVEELAEATEQNKAMHREMRDIAEKNPGMKTHAAAATLLDVTTGRPRILPASVDCHKTCEHPVRVRQKKSKVKKAIFKSCGAPVAGGSDNRFCAQHLGLVCKSQPGL
jgi:hypothetical protein